MEIANSRRRAKILSFRDLIAWQKAMDLADMIYDLTENFPKREHYGLAYQLRKSAVSIPSNIAEGHGRENTGSFVQHLRIAQGSLKELETQALLCRRNGFSDAAATDALVASTGEIGKMLRALIRSLQASRG